MERSNNTARETFYKFSRILKPLLIAIALLWLLEIIDQLFLGSNLDNLGLVPRTTSGLRGILFAPFLHSGFDHVLANTIPLAVLGSLVLLRFGRLFWAVSGIIMLISGIGVWLVGPPNTIHIGASALIFGYFSFLVGAAYYERSYASIGLAILVIVLYGGIIQGILPQGNGISWQGHIFGAIGGLVAARYLVRRKRLPVDSIV